MSEGWWIVVVGGFVIVWAIALDVRLGTDRRLAGWWVRWAARRGGWAGPLSALLSLGCVLVFAVLAILGDNLGESLDDPRWALVVSLPAMLAYVPFNFATTPTQGGAYRSWRSDLADAGADPPLQRAIAWWAGPPSLAGMVAMIASLVTSFVP
jgi:hypothetical protein